MLPSALFGFWGVSTFQAESTISAMTIELIGRMQLWSSALSDAAECLELAARVDITATSEVVKAEVVAQQRHYEVQTGRRFSPHQSYSEDAAVLAGFVRVLPLTDECFKAARHLRNLAIVYFMQMYATGSSSPRSVADNRKDLVTDIRQKVEVMAYCDPAERENFRALVFHVRQARDKRIGHADGAEFDVRHQPYSVTSSAYVVSPVAWSELDAAIRRLRPSILKILGDLMECRSAG